MVLPKGDALGTSGQRASPNLRRFISCAPAIVGASRTLTAYAFNGRAPHSKIVEFDLDALAFFEVIDSDTIQCVRAKETFVSSLSYYKAAAKLP